MAQRLPASLSEALACTRGSEFVRRVLPGQMLESYLRVKSEEAARYEAAPDKIKYEMEHYFHMV